MSELAQTVGELRKVLEGGDSYPCPKSALCPSILGNFLILLYGVSGPFSICCKIVSEQSSGLCASTYAQAGCGHGSGTPDQEARERLAHESQQLTKD